ncbi:Peptidoglycan/LPS O-acetylase OafA/YrhL, contains acyltransferase and SGNH-hydrolase domains [Marivirga sericea]|uniref:Peptidoglycan/LPS O-acetylase OafA/YrhL, contains acyltransferase and SGNH-hydrolase domains n=1 Tax=Marivirga sericea TaxID=1028 RepID=A0A1X7K5C8_9BACT|nr:acyltransferase [Marivirga sericea]SMG36187.1 Peptidoglycan/LPS O-acetylase OafA/YrhL, contains acyltransferase and SGNH-hydrolase domains [Marivirga sericea]
MIAEATRILMEKIEKRNIGIDVLRGLSILAVILLHLNIHFGISNTFLKELLPAKLFSLLFWSGFYGVVVFFTLSGYLITNSIIRKWTSLSKIDIKMFYWQRFSRIIPLLTVLLLVLSILHVLDVQGFVINADQTSLGRAIFSALTFHINWLEIQVGYLPANWDVLWSISIEETFYLFFPIICLFLKKEWRFLVIVGLFLVVSPWARTQLFEGNELADKNHLAFVDSIALGCMTAIITSKLTFSKALNYFFLTLGWSMVILIFVFKGFIYKAGIVDLGLNITILSVGVSLILFWMHEKHKSKEENRHYIFGWLRNMGIYSYEIYLTHMFIVIFGAQLFEKLSIGSNWLIPYLISLLLISYFLGKIIFHKFSEPVNIWLRRKLNN